MTYNKHLSYVMAYNQHLPDVMIFNEHLPDVMTYNQHLPDVMAYNRHLPDVMTYNHHLLDVMTYKQHLPDVIIPTENHASLGKTRCPYLAQLGLTARTLETSCVPVSIHGQQQEPVLYPSATACTRFGHSRLTDRHSTVWCAWRCRNSRAHHWQVKVDRKTRPWDQGSCVCSLWPGVSLSLSQVYPASSNELAPRGTQSPEIRFPHRLRSNLQQSTCKTDLWTASVTLNEPLWQSASSTSETNKQTYTYIC